MAKQFNPQAQRQGTHTPQNPDGSGIEITTSRPNVTLRELTAAAAQAYYGLAIRNQAHLTRFGNYASVKDVTLRSVTEDLTNPKDNNARFGIWHDDVLIGRVDLSPRAPGHYVLGYWLGEEHIGQGYATIGCKALIEHGRRTLGATDIFAGVTKGNTASEAVLNRLGFQAVADKDTYTLFHLPLENEDTPS